MVHKEKAEEEETPVDGYLPIKALKEWLGSLADADKDVIVPVERDGKVGYENLAQVGDKEVLVHFRNSHRPPKDLVFPQSEVMLRYKRRKEGEIEHLEIEEVRPEMKESVLFGIRPCDARAVSILDAVFSGPNVDPYYWDRRKKLTLVGLACTDPHYNCFCTITGGSPHGTDGLDILLTEIDGGFYAQVLTEKGADLLASGPFKDAKDDHRKKASEVHKASEDAMAKPGDEDPLNPHEVAERLEGLFDDPYWDRTAKKCLGCGACTYLCPTCHCFDITDEGGKMEGRRVRTWDSCQFSEFTMHSSSHNPRPIKKNRIRQRVFHKFKYMPENLGDFGCVGCGRCITHCPVNMDIFRIVMDLEEVEQ
jgi:ferredoxin